MATSPLKTLRFRIIFSTGWWCWILLHAFVLHWYGFEWKTAFADSLISNLVLVGALLLVTINLQFYIPRRNRYVYIIGLCTILSILWLLLTRFLLFILLGRSAEYQNFFSHSLPLRMVIGFLIIGCMALVSVLWYTLQDQQETEKRKTEVEKLSRDAELFQLRQQLQPHFLFNSLNSINALIGMQPQQARMMIQQLSDFLRGTLKKEDHQWISLEDELQHLGLYLDIEKVRFGHRLSAIVRNEAGKGRQLPVMLLQPVVENAIKFGLYDTTGDITITIEAVMAGDQLIIRISNPFDPETSLPRKGMGFGLNSVRRRLFLLFARTDLLEADAEGDLFITTIKIPQAK